MQVVYISNRPNIFAETLQFVSLFMPFVDKAIVCVPDAQKHQFLKIHTTLALEVVTESSVLTDKEAANFSNIDHQRRNYLLRSKLVQSSMIDAQFIMSDDDARPLKPISIETFIQNGRYRRYYFYDLASWDNNQTEFDAGQISTYAVLNFENLEHLSYASHMPQIIDRDLFNEASTFFHSHSTQQPLCEWSTYFNFAANKYPERFQPAEAFVTLCWPEHPLSWQYYVEPAGYSFENYTPLLYQNEGSFKNLSSVAKSHTNIVIINIEKIILWKKLTIRCLYPERTKGLAKYFRLRTWVNKLFRHQ